MPFGIRPLSDLLLSHRFFRFFLVCLHLVVFFGQRSIANVDLAENFKIFDLDWNSSNDSFDVSEDSITQFLFLITIIMYSEITPVRNFLSATS